MCSLLKRGGRILTIYEQLNQAMIIYGKKVTELGSENILDKCSNCGTANSITLTIYQKYAHIFWIPFVPIGKLPETTCSHCRQVRSKDQFTLAVIEQYKTFKTNTKTPVWTFSGCFLLAIFIIFMSAENRQNKAENTIYVAIPQKGDIYEIKSNGRYTLYKVNQVVKDSIFVLVNQYETDRITGLSDLKKKGNEAYSTDALMILKTDLKTMLDTGEIIDVDRK
jgi:hypothetical protein